MVVFKKYNFVLHFCYLQPPKGGQKFFEVADYEFEAVIVLLEILH